MLQDSAGIPSSSRLLLTLKDLLLEHSKISLWYLYDKKYKVSLSTMEDWKVGRAHLQVMETTGFQMVTSIGEARKPVSIAQ